LTELLYFPGCSLKQEAREFERSGIAVMQALGFPLVELERWNCCGTVFSLTQDDLMHQVGPGRILIRAQEAGGHELVTLCSMCFNTLKRAQRFLVEDPDRLTTVNAFMDEEQDYQGHVQVRHLLEIFRDMIGWDHLATHIQRPLEGLRIACYYGCTLLRPPEIGIDSSEQPIILQTLVETLGAEAIPFGFETECCGSYQVTDQRPIVIERAHRILNHAQQAGANLLITSCPLCYYNLDDTQTDLRATLSEFQPFPVFYFTQVIAHAMGLEIDVTALKKLQAIERQSLEMVQ
jgi:heterodisulfide reductase subunit B